MDASPFGAIHVRDDGAVIGLSSAQESFQTFLIEADDDLAADRRDRRRHVSQSRQLVQSLRVARDVALSVGDTLP